MRQISFQQLFVTFYYKFIETSKYIFTSAYYYILSLYIYYLPHYIFFNNILVQLSFYYREIRVFNHVLGDILRNTNIIKVNH